MKEHLDFNGMAAVTKLVEARLENDIALTEAILRVEESKEISTSSGPMAMLSNLLRDKARESLRKEIAQKRLWRDAWHRAVWEGLEKAEADVGHLQGKSLPECLASYPTGTPLEFRRFLICQEAVLAPVYGEFEGLPKGLKERESKRQYQLVAEQAGFDPAVGRDIHENTEAFLAGLKGHREKLVWFTVIGSLTVASVLLVSAVPIAGVIGGLAGFHGAAAISFGLAFLGGGSLAAGGMGMAGGVLMLGVGGGALGAGTGACIAKYVAHVPTEASALEMAMLVNYVRHLRSVTGTGLQNARSATEEAVSQFLKTKHLLETEVLQGNLDSETAKKAGGVIRILNVTFDRLAE
jgi:hypothetical protein